MGRLVLPMGNCTTRLAIIEILDLNSHMPLIAQDLPTLQIITQQHYFAVEIGRGGYLPRIFFLQ